jgi:hypothetical protein
MKENPADTRPKEADPEPLKVVAEALRGLRFGTVKLIIQDGVLIRVERTENRQVAQRLPKS